MEGLPFEQGKIAGQRVIDENGLVFPMVLLPHHNQHINSVESCVQTIQESREWIDHRLKEVGALIFRGFPLKTASDFNAVMEQKFPELVKKMEKEGLFYHTRLPPKDNSQAYVADWQTLYGTEDKEEAEKRATFSGIKSTVSWEGNTMLIQMGPLLPIREVEGKKKCKAWFNLLRHQEIPSTLLGDGSVVPREAIESCIEMMEDEAVDVKWEAGDVVVIDNRFVQHARRPSKRPRRVLAAFCK